jgi:RNA polymerase sigma factor (sigma-70 family)
VRSHAERGNEGESLTAAVRKKLGMRRDGAGVYGRGIHGPLPKDANMSATTSDFLRHLRTLAARQAIDNLSDQQLLKRFHSQRSEESFAALVQRHGPMVWSVCCRVLHHTQDAEDAFQAAFLVLAAKAASLRQPPLLSSWLHGVAYHIALRQKAKAIRRSAHERCVGPPPPVDAMDDIHWRELRSVLDEELQKMPQKYRAPLVLCYLEARTQDEAAKHLGWSKNTFGRRMKRARELLTQRLTRRGITLSAALTAPLSIDGAATATVPPLLAAGTVRAGLAVAMGQATCTLISAQVIALTDGGVASLLAKKASVAVVLLVSLALGVGGLLAHRAIPSRTLVEGPSAPMAAPQAPPRSTRSAGKDTAIEIKGRVLGPDGKAFAGARLFLLSDMARKKADAAVRAVTDTDGRFRFPAKPADFDAKGKAILAVTASGFGPDWAEITTKPQDALTLRLVKDDVPIKGRVLDLEGKPVANVTVRALNLHQTDLDWWLNKKPKPARTDYPNWIDPAALDVPAQAVTGADGRFQLHGLGRERLVYLLIEGDTIERVYCKALTLDGKSLDLPKPKGGEPIYPATFDHIAAPTKPIVGSVRDKGTGKPLVGFIVLTGRQTGKWIDSATTDERGRYRIVGCPKQREYDVIAEGRPYFAGEKRNLADTPGLEPLVVDFELERGIEITGRVFNKATGEPIEYAEVTYRALMDNPYLKRVSGLYQGFRSDGRNRTKSDGSFFVIGLPGPGYLTALASNDDYHKPAPPADWEKVTPYLNAAPQLAHAWARINPSKEDPKSMRCDIALEPAKPILGQVLDPDGKPLDGYFVAGLNGSPLTLSNEQNLHEKPTFQVRGFDPGRPRILIFIHPEKKLGKVVILREAPRESLQVRLGPLGAMAGRVLDAEGRPRAGLQVHAEFSPKDNDHLLRRTLFVFEMGLQLHHLDPAAKTDASGKFRLDGLMPGLKYTLLVSEGEMKSGMRTVVRREALTVDSAKTKDLGYLKSK